MKKSLSITTQILFHNMCDTFKFKIVPLLIFFACQLIGTPGTKVVLVDEFRQIIESEKYVLVVFSKDKCSICEEAIRQLDSVQTPEGFETEIVKISLNDAVTAESYGVVSMPQLVFFRQGNPVLYEIPEDSGVILAEDVSHWLEGAKEVATKELNEDSFEHLTQASTGATTGDWLVIFYSLSCKSYLPAIEGAALQLKQRMNVASVDISTNPALADRFNIQECPTTYFFRLGKMYLYFNEEKEHYNVKSLRLFATNWYKNVKGEKVPGIPTMFEKLTESIAQSLKEKMNSPNRNKFLLTLAIIMGIIAFIVSLTVVLCSRRNKDTKTE